VCSDKQSRVRCAAALGGLRSPGPRTGCAGPRSEKADRLAMIDDSDPAEQKIRDPKATSSGVTVEIGQKQR
jgi:hypothetical protein